MPPPVDPNLIKKEQEALKKVVVRSFTVNPRSVKTFGTTTIAWNVTVPESEFDIAVNLNGDGVAPTGSKSVSLQQTRSFTLSASTENAGRQLKKATVTVDASECRAQLLEAFPIIQQIKKPFNDRFSGSSKFKLRGTGTEVTLGDGGISIGVRLGLNVPDWFDADMNMGIQLSVLAGVPVKVAAKSGTVNVKWGFFEHLASLGCSGFVQSGMEQLAREFMADTVNTNLVPALSQGFTDQVRAFTASLRDTDPQHREYLFTALAVSSAGVTLTACPR